MSTWRMWKRIGCLNANLIFMTLFLLACQSYSVKYILCSVCWKFTSYVYQYTLYQCCRCVLNANGQILCLRLMFNFILIKSLSPRFQHFEEKSCIVCSDTDCVGAHNIPPKICGLCISDRLDVLYKMENEYEVSAKTTGPFDRI